MSKTSQRKKASIEKGFKKGFNEEKLIKSDKTDRFIKKGFYLGLNALTKKRQDIPITHFEDLP